MGKYKEESKQLLKAIGGKENIVAISHCATRLRFVLNDESIADKQAIEDISTVKGTFTNAGQFQVIIGNDVATFYNEFTTLAGVEGVSKEIAKAKAKQNQGMLQRLVGVLSEVFTPLIPAIIVGGLILGFRNVLEAIPMGFLDGRTIAETSQFWNGVNRFLWLPGEAIFHFLPVGVTWSIAKKMGTTQILGIVLGITLVSPQLLNAWGAASATSEMIAVHTIDFGGFEVFLRGYQAQVIPAMLAGFLLAYLEIFFRKRIPEAVSMIFVPFFSLIPAIAAAHLVLGPIGWTIGDVLSSVVNAGLTSSFSWLFGGLFGLLYAPLVVTGLHHTSLAIDSQLIASFGSTNLWPMIALSNIAQGAAVFAIYLLHKGDKKEEQVSVPSMISAWLGVTEPAMFGINLKYMYPFVAAMIGSGLASMFSTIMGVRAHSIGVGGLPGVIAILPQDMMNFGIAMVVGLVTPILLTFALRKVAFLNKAEKEMEEQTDKMVDEFSGVSKTKDIKIYSITNGEVLPLEKAQDSVFADGLMGKGVVYSTVDGTISSPFDAEVTMIFPTKHAIGLTSKEGVEVLIHIGLDTVELNGAHFTALVQKGEQVVRGQKLIECDTKAIEKAGYVLQTPIVVTNGDAYNLEIPTEEVAITTDDLLMQASKWEV